MITYVSCIKESKFFREKNDCAVIAVAVATQTPYQEVHRLFRRFGRIDRRSTPFLVTSSVLIHLGFSTEYPGGNWFLRADEDPRYKFVDPLQTNRKKFTVTSLEKAVDKRSIYLVRTTGHIYTIYRGVTECYVNGTRKRICDVTKVVEMMSV